MKALTVGGAMVDSIAIINSDRIEQMTMRNADASFLLLEEGSKTEAEDISTHSGGGAVNTAVCMSRLGFDTAAVVKLGADQRAETLLTRLESEGVSTRWITRDRSQPTGASLLISSHDRNAAVFTFRGANTLLSMDDIKRDALAVDLVYICSLSNQAADCFPSLAKAAKEAKCLVAANPGIRQLTARGEAFLDTAKYLDILLINRKEASALVPMLSATVGEGGPSPVFEPGEEVPDLLRRGLWSGGFSMSLMRFFSCLRKAGVGTVVVTDGRRGVFVANGGTIIHCPALPVETVGSAGAGDAFGATFAVMIALGKPLDEALKAGSMNAASVIRYIDTQTGLLTLDALEERLAKEDCTKVRRWPMIWE